MENSMNQISAWIDKKLHEKFVDVCRREGYTQGALIQKLIRQWLDNHEKAVKA